VLSKELVQRVGVLAKLRLTEEEVETFRQQLSAVLDYASVLERLDTSSIPPTASVLPLSNVLRADCIETSMPQGDALANAPRAQDGFFGVKPVLD
jgi:aspartyl-tRNA(Asn)/glutamyl-tRNA(Gln) amidotransferase subunit C